jgi:hypothetical protein
LVAVAVAVVTEVMGRRVLGLLLVLYLQLVAVTLEQMLMVVLVVLAVAVELVAAIMRVVVE